MTHILIVDDDARLRTLVRIYAENEGFLCSEAENGTNALEKLSVQNPPFDLIILDIMMPGPDGFDILEQIRATSQVPVIMLSARSEEYDKLQGFRLGVDDYVTKPFSPKELMARVQAVLKRSGKTRRDAPLTFGGLSIHPDSRTVTVDGKPLALPPKEFDLLLKLAQNERIVFSREQLMEMIWGYQYYSDGRTVDTHIKGLRDHLGPYRDTIKTVWGVGYKYEYVEKDRG